MDELEGKVLVAKPGKQKEFEEAMANTVKIAQGTLGWKGQAEMMWEIGAAEVMFGIKTKSKKKGVVQLEDMIRQAYLQTIMDNAEWVPEEQAKGRHQANKILFGEKDQK
jgi:hypothetical protein